MYTFLCVLLNIVGAVFFATSMAGFWSYMFVSRVSVVAAVGGELLRGTNLDHLERAVEGPSLVMPICFLLAAVAAWVGAWAVLHMKPAPRRPRSLRSKRASRTSSLRR